MGSREAAQPGPGRCRDLFRRRPPAWDPGLADSPFQRAPPFLGGFSDPRSTPTPLALFHMRCLSADRVLGEEGAVARSSQSDGWVKRLVWEAQQAESTAVGGPDLGRSAGTSGGGGSLAESRKTRVTWERRRTGRKELEAHLSGDREGGAAVGPAYRARMPSPQQSPWACYLGSLGLSLPICQMGDSSTRVPG